MADIATTALRSSHFEDEKVVTDETNRSGSFADEKDIDEKGTNEPVEDLNELVNELAVTADLGDVYDGPREIDLGADGKERPIGVYASTQSVYFNAYLLLIATDQDYALRLLSLEDDPTLPVLTFRMWFLGLGLSCFGSVLGQIFVRGLVSSYRQFLIDDAEVFPSPNGKTYSARGSLPHRKLTLHQSSMSARYFCRYLYLIYLVDSSIN